MSKLKYFIIEMRLKQWTKNVFVFPAIIFSKQFTNTQSVLRILTGFIIFCSVSSSVYIINDIIDKDKDLHHPTKSKRPIASGNVSIQQGVILAFIMLIVGLMCGYFLSWKFLIALSAYIVNSFAYSIYLKNQPILDIMSIAGGFVIRTLAGALLTGVQVSPWLLMCTSVLSLFLAANKRRSELEIIESDAGRYKATLAVYTKEFLDMIIAICIALAIVLYSLYSYFTNIPLMAVTIIFVLYCLFRYQLLANSDRSCDNIELILFKDKPLLISIALWGISCFYIVLIYY